MAAVVIYSEGTFIYENGTTGEINSKEVKIEPVDYWESKIHAKYPSGWKFSIPDRGILFDAYTLYQKPGIRSISKLLGRRCLNKRQIQE